MQTVVDALAAGEMGHTFEQYRYPPVRGLIARLGDQDHALILLAHHVRTRPAPSKSCRWPARISESRTCHTASGCPC